MAETFPDHGSDADPLPPGVSRFGYEPAPDVSCPPEYADVPISELFAQIDAARQQRATAAAEESLPAGFRPRTPLIPMGSGFESGGALDTAAPSAVLAGLADAATRDGGLADLDDDELVGMLRVWQRVESWASANGLAAVAELARRRPAKGAAPAAPGKFPEQFSEFAVDEVAAALTLTGQAASTSMAMGLDLAIRLPATHRAHHDGVIDRAKVRLITEATRILSAEDARAVEAQILARAGTQTTGQLRAALARAVIAVDPDAAIRRREEAQKDPRVRRWQEDAGTAALAGYNLPPADVLAADQQLTTRALALRDAGLPGSLEELRARAYLDALLDRDSTRPAPEPSPAASPPPNPKPTAATAATPRPSPATPAPSPATPAPTPAPELRLPALINLTLPLTTQLGLSDAPGVVAGFGPVDARLARHLAALAATDPRTRCCLTITTPGGSAIGHGCLPGAVALASLGTRDVKVTVSPLARGSCDHHRQEPGYQPSRRLRHLVTARTSTCTAPGCRQPAARCDLDHTVPYDQGGRTCECNLARPGCDNHTGCPGGSGNGAAWWTATTTAGSLTTAW